MKKISVFIILTMLFASLLTACSSQEKAAAYDDYIDREKRIAVEAGDVYGDVAGIFSKRKK